MNRQQKETVIEALRDEVQKSEGMFLVDMHGMTVGQVQRLRKSLRQHGGKMKVAKNTLARIVAREVDWLSDFEPHLKSQVAFIFATQETPTVAKLVWDAAKESAKLKVVAGCFEEKVIDQDTIKFLATLPPRPVLLATVCGNIKAPLVRNVTVLHQVLSRFIGTLKSLSAKRESE